MTTINDNGHLVTCTAHPERCVALNDDVTDDYGNDVTGVLFDKVFNACSALGRFVDWHTPPPEQGHL